MINRYQAEIRIRENYIGKKFFSCWMIDNKGNNNQRMTCFYSLEKAERYINSKEFKKHLEELNKRN